jgi:hypothetical protein
MKCNPDACRGDYTDSQLENLNRNAHCNSSGPTCVIFNKTSWAMTEGTPFYVRSEFSK